MNENHKRKYFIFNGSKSYFDKKLVELSVENSGHTFRELIMLQDSARKNNDNNSRFDFKEKV